ncbi:TorD/DmsD family molecular chaperone [Shewanella halifaxensis]|nr:molecular chaperone TorD family protein [Shewanella halifaxensis]
MSSEQLINHKDEIQAIDDDLILASLNLLYRFFYFEPEDSLLLKVEESHILHFWQAEMGISTLETEIFLSQASALEQLQSDHLSLFVGIGMPKAMPWGSVYLSEDNLLLQKSTYALAGFLEDKHLRFQLDEKQPLDHIGLCLSALASLLERHIRAKDASSERCVCEFLCVHILPWSFRFTELLTKNAETALYRLLGKITLHTLTQLQAKWQLTPVQRQLYY